MVLFIVGLRADESPYTIAILDESWLEKMRTQLPLDDEEEVAMLDTLVESLHGEELTRMLVAEGDRDFLARQTLVQWLYTTQPELRMQ